MSNNTNLINKEEDIERENLENQQLDSDNIYSGIGDPWNVTHWANRTDNNLELSFSNGSYDLTNIPLNTGWETYKLNTSIKDLYDQRNWCNGTFNFGTDNGTAGPDFPGDYWSEDDTPYILNPYQNWTFDYRDKEIEWDAYKGAWRNYTNNMSGNYFQNIGGRDCLELRMNGYDVDNDQYWSGTNYGDACWWNTTLDIPRGEVIDADLKFSLYTDHATNNNWFFRIKIDGHLAYSIGMGDLVNMGNTTWHDFSIPKGEWLRGSDIFQGNLNDSTVEINCTLIYDADSSAKSGFIDQFYQRVYIDNVELIPICEVKPEQIQLKLNNITVYDVDWGKGTNEIYEQKSGIDEITINLTSDDTWMLSGINYSINANPNLYTIKKTLKSNYETNIASLGTYFEVSNNTKVDWECYGYIGVPTKYEETEMRVNFPTDVDITWVSSAQEPTNNIIASCDKSVPGTLIIPVKDISATPDGFWKIKGESPNYCDELSFYTNTTNSPSGNDWTPSNTFVSGDFINITANITDSALVSGHIQQTKAFLQIRFPNGTIWTAQNQWANPNIQGFVNFTSFTIPDTQSPYYIAGEYEAIVTWNNSYSSYGLNETGVIYQKFNVVHDSSLKADQEQYYFNDVIEDSTINLKVSFKDSVNNDSIEGANVYTYGLPFPSGQMQNFSEISPGFYFLEYDTSGANLGNNNITIYANSSYFINKDINITLEIIRETQLEVNSTILSILWSENFSIELNFTEKYSGVGVQAIINNDWIGDIDILNPDLGIYILTANTSLYAINQLHSLNLLVYNDTYVNQSIDIDVEVKERDTLLQDISLNGSITNSIAYPLGEMLNISVKYTDVLSGQLIDTNTIELRKGVSKIGDFNQEINTYNISINTTQLELGGNTLTIYANKDNYSSISEDITITVNERDTFLEIELNNTVSSTFSYYNLTIGEILNLTVWYRDSLETNNQNIIGAEVNLTGDVTPQDLDYRAAYDHYNITLNSTELGQGVKFITINADRVNYSRANEVVKLNIIERKSNLTLFINGTPYLEGMKYQAELGEFINITIKYIDNTTTNHISSATVDLTDAGSLSEQSLLYQYNRTLLSNNLGQGVNLFTLIAQKQNYQTQTINFFIEIIESNTILELFLEGQNKTVEQSIEVIIGETVNVTIFYRDEATNFIPNATVQINGDGVPLTNLTQNDIKEYYNITIDTNNLGKGVNILTLTAGKTNYQQHTIKIKIIISDKPTGFQLFLNNVNKTLDPYYELPLGNTLNVTFFYFDNETKAHLDGANIALKFGGTTIGNFTEFSQQYTIILNASDLNNIGLNFFTIYAQKSNYKSLSPQIRINVKRILGQVTTSKGVNTINILVGESITLEIILNNLDFPGRVLDASVGFTWELGEGYLVDPDNDGIYEATLENLPSGTYTITITVDAGQNYDFDRFYITISVGTPEGDVTIIFILIGVAISTSIVLTGYLILYQKVLKYPKPVRKVRKYRSNIKKKNLEKKIEISDRIGSFNAIYNAELGGLGKLLKDKSELAIPKEKELGKSQVIDKYKEKIPDKITKNKGGGGD